MTQQRSGLSLISSNRQVVDGSGHVVWGFGWAVKESSLEECCSDFHDADLKLGVWAHTHTHIGTHTHPQTGWTGAQEDSISHPEWWEGGCAESAGSLILVWLVLGKGCTFHTPTRWYRNETLTWGTTERVFLVFQYKEREETTGSWTWGTLAASVFIVQSHFEYCIREDSSAGRLEWYSDCVCAQNFFSLLFLLPHLSPPFSALWNVGLMSVRVRYRLTNCHCPSSLHPSLLLSPAVALSFNSVTSCSLLHFETLCSPPFSCLLLLRLQVLSWLEQRRGQTERIWVRNWKKPQKEKRNSDLSCLTVTGGLCVWSKFLRPSLVVLLGNLSLKAPWQTTRGRWEPDRLYRRAEEDEWVTSTICCLRVEKEEPKVTLQLGIPSSCRLVVNLSLVSRVSSV